MINPSRRKKNEHPEKRNESPAHTDSKDSQVTPKRPRGRPRKNPTPSSTFKTTRYISDASSSSTNPEEDGTGSVLYSNFFPIPEELTRLYELREELQKVHTRFEFVRISLASPQRIKQWGTRTLVFEEEDPTETTENEKKTKTTEQEIGEIHSMETLSYKNYSPVPDGLFCQKTFGPIRTGFCGCNTKHALMQIGIICPKCLVEITHSRVRRYRAGYISLSIPVTHFWYLMGAPSYLCVLLNAFAYETTTFEPIQPFDLQNFIYPQEDRRSPPSFFNNLIREWETLKDEELGDNSLKFLFEEVGIPGRNVMRSEVLKFILEKLGGTPKRLEDALDRDRDRARPRSTRRFDTTLSTRERLLMRRMRLLESFLVTETSPSWMILETLSVLPPTLRPIVQMGDGQIVSSDLNEMYRQVAYSSVLAAGIGEIDYFPRKMVDNAQSSLQETVDHLFDNERTAHPKLIELDPRPYLEQTDLPYQSLTANLEGKEGRFRQNLLGKRVDYSGRSVIVVGPTLRLNQCGLPYGMAKELFFPLLLRWFEVEFMNRYATSSIPFLRLTCFQLRQWFFSFDILVIRRLLYDLTHHYHVLLNRAPTLHRFGIQAFEAVVVMEKAIHLHPLVCPGFNADFDGDQMAVHLPLYTTSQMEGRVFMSPSSNILSPADGSVVLKPSQDIVIGCYYLTLRVHQDLEKESYLYFFPSERAVILAYGQKQVELHSLIWVRYRVARFDCYVTKRGLLWFDPSVYLKASEHSLRIQKIVPFHGKYALFTEQGILIVAKPQSKVQRRYFLKQKPFATHSKRKKRSSKLALKYTVTDWFQQTTPGRILFATTVKHAL